MKNRKDRSWKDASWHNQLKCKKKYNKKKSIIEKTFSNKPKKTLEIEKQNIIKNLETIATR